MSLLGSRDYIVLYIKTIQNLGLGTTPSQKTFILYRELGPFTLRCRWQPHNVLNYAETERICQSWHKVLPVHLKRTA